MSPRATRAGIENFRTTYDKPAYVGDALARVAKRLEGVLDSPVPARMQAEFASQRPLLEHRLQVLPDILAQPLNATLAWPPMGWAA